MGWSRWATFLDHWKREDFWCNFRFQIEPLAPVSAIERHLVMKGFGQPQTENSSGPEDNMSDSDDENDATPVSFPGKFGHRKFLVFYWFYAWHTTSWAVNQGQTATSKYNYLSGTNRTNFGVEHFKNLGHSWVWNWWWIRLWIGRWRLSAKCLEPNLHHKLPNNY